MSSTTPPADSATPNRPGSERRQSLNKFVNRAKSILRGDNSRGGKRQSILGLPSDPSEEAASGSANPAPEIPPATTTTTKTTTSAAAGKSKAKPTDATKKSVTVPRTRDAEYQERARKMFEKYGFTLEPHEWHRTSPNAERVEKSIRMRVHRSCHRCSVTYGPDKTCANCGHQRCKKCPRFPAKKAKGSAEKPATLITTNISNYKARPALTIPARIPGAPDRVLKDVTQRTHRKCHKCEVQFSANGTTCAGCGHVRCTKCPRQPPKLHKYPRGYPGDVQSEPEETYPDWAKVNRQRTIKKPRQRIRWYCHSCDSLYEHKGKPCAKCQHTRCDDCRREPPKKVKPPPDPQALEALEEKLATLKITRLGG